MDSESRNRDTRARAEEALVRFALLAEGHSTDFVVIGGLNPDFLAPYAPNPHMGTTEQLVVAGDDADPEQLRADVMISAEQFLAAYQDL
ncbi:hypothetical protein L2X99_10450 [Microbacterium sp. KUDC0406]|uniref:hypothetical protein n=1 Tax=Microbacterium sp. KUDC0406 TaxID=2909588 RepID=UPI001F23739E|nr:hypothetical protein [Microbacterium sp. KUDC0406]UJP08904.1 hypothetical protein L2X99_10450 [Microbacterium sp. KUDC0406]